MDKVIKLLPVTHLQETLDAGNVQRRCKFPRGGTFFASRALLCPDMFAPGWGVGEGRLMKEKTEMQYATALRSRRGDDGLGPNSDIGTKLRALYGAVQDETIPDKFLELLEKLDQVEQQGKPDAIQE